jgi:hypothetical protein
LAGTYERLRRALRAGGLPIGEAMHPVALLALAVMIINDWVLKPRLGPSALTGKLSDIGGLIAAPVLLTALIGLVLRVARAADPYLTQRRLVLAIAATGAVFAAIKLSERAAGWFVAAISVVRPAEVYLDPTDLLCLPVLAISYWIGRDELRRLSGEQKLA